MKALYWQTFKKVLSGLFERPMWMMLLVSLCVMSLAYLNHTVWDLPVAVIDQDHSPSSRAIARHLDATPKIAVKNYDRLADAQHDLLWRRLFAVIIIPTDVEKKNITW